MSADERGGLKAAFTNFKPPKQDEQAELKLLGRVVDENTQPELPGSYQLPADEGGLRPKPLYQREVLRQLSFRCPLNVAAELRRKAAFNQLEQQEIIVEGLKKVLAGLSDPPPGWES